MNETCPLDTNPDPSPDFTKNRYFCEECVMVTWGGGTFWSGCKHDKAGLAAYAARIGGQL